MTIGPDPMTRTRLMSVRLGMFQIWRRAVMTAGGGRLPRTSAPFFHDVEKLPEQVVRIVRPGRSFRVVLHAEHRLRLVAESLDRAVVQVDVRDPDVFRQRLRVDGKAVILGSDFDLTGLEFLHRMIRATVS